MDRRNAGLLILGLAVGFLSSALGIGGGALIVPALMMWFGYTMKDAAGTSLMMIAPAAAVGLLIHLLAGTSIQPVLTALLIIASLFGVRLGGSWSERIHARVLTILFSLFLVFTGLQMMGIFPLKLVISQTYPAIILLGILTGLLSGLFGIGGGMIIIPALTLSFGMGVQQSITTSLAVVIPTALSGAYGRKIRFADIGRLIPGTVAGAIIGALVAAAASPAILKSSFGVFLLLIAFLIAWRN